MNNQLMVCCASLLAVFALSAQQEQTDSLDLQVLDEVVVSDSRFELKRVQSGKTVIRIDAGELERSQGKTVAELLNARSGIEIAGSRGRQGEVLGVYARGGRGRQVLVVIDGVRVTDPSSTSQEYDLRLLAADQLQSIEIIKGASSTLYGTNAATAVINITTKEVSQKKFEARFQSSVGTNQATDDQSYSAADFNNHVRMSGTLGRLEYATGISQAYSDNLSSLVTPEGEEDPFSRYNADLRLGYRISDSLRVRLYGNRSAMRSAYDEAFGQFDAPYTYSTLQERVGTSLKASYRNGEIHMNAGLTEFYSDNKSAFPGTFSGRTQQLDVFNKYRFNGRAYTLLGLSLVKDRADFEGSRDFTLADPYVNVVYLSPFGLNMNTGIRLNTHSEYGSQWVYSLNPSFTFSRESGYLKLMGSYATSYITPSLTQLFGEFGANPELQPETNRTVEAGMEWAGRSGFRASVLYFGRKEENLVIFDSSNFLYRNATSTIRARGLEAEIFWKPSERLRFSANYTFTERQGDDAIRIPKHKVNALLGADLGKGGYGSLQYAFTGSRLDTDFNTFTNVPLDAFSLLQLYLSKELIADTLNVFLNLENLLNSRYTEVLGFTTRGRNVRIGFSLEL